MIGGGLNMALIGHGGTVTPDHGSGLMRDGPGGMLTQTIGSTGTGMTCGGHGVALTLHPGKGIGLTLIFTRGGHGGMTSPRLGTDGMQVPGHGGGVNLTHG